MTKKSVKEIREIKKVERVLDKVHYFSLAMAYYLMGIYDKTTYEKIKKIQDDIEDFKEHFITAIKSKGKVQQNKDQDTNEEYLKLMKKVLYEVLAKRASEKEGEQPKEVSK